MSDDTTMNAQTERRYTLWAFAIALIIIATLVVGFLALGLAGVGLVMVGITPVIYVILVMISIGG